MSIAEHLKNTIWDTYRKGLTTSSGGNISMKDENDHIWISPSQIDKGYLSADDFAQIDLNGKSLNGNKASMESPFHLEVYKSFPEVGAICHIHPPVLVALSVLRPCYNLFKILDEFKCGFADYAIPGSKELGENIVDAIAEDSKLVIMQNHGVIAVGESTEEAVERIVKLNDRIANEFELNVKTPEVFEGINDQSIGFYTQRAHKFLNPNKINVQKDDSEYVAEMELRSFYNLVKSDLELLSHIIPESYLILGTISFEDDQKSQIIINENRTVKVKADNLYKLYDRMEVLDFSARVIDYANRMGTINSLNEEQIQELKEKFDIKKLTT